MKSAQFAEAYSRQRPWIRRDTHPIRGELLLQGAEQSSRFSDALMGYLQGAILLPEEAAELIEAYRSWLGTDFSRMVYDENLFDDEPDEDVYDEFYDEIAFHATNLSMASIWNRLLTGEQPLKTEIEASQIQLACISVMQTRPLAMKFKKGDLYVTRGDTYRFKDPRDHGLMSLATQIDSMVAYLELMKENSNLIVVPAPPQFESSTQHSERNSDLIAVDTENGTARGIQIKMNARISKRRDHQYDDEYVTILDGMNDLKNFVFMRKSTGSESIAVPMPGIYSAHLLTSKKQLFRFGQKRGTGVMQYDSAHNLAATRQMAFALADLAPSVNSQVNQRLSDIALRELKLS